MNNNPHSGPHTSQQSLIYMEKSPLAQISTIYQVKLY
jgi:hypothetical protein